MKIGVLSDTHGETQSVRQAVRVLNQLGVSLLIHCGDIGLEIVPLLNGLRTHFVYGNIDDADQLRQAIVDPNHTLHDQLGTLEIEGRRVAFLHGHDVKLLRHAIHSGHWDLVCHGHTHAFSRSMEGKTLVLNPGALARTSHPSLAVVELPSLEVTQIPLRQVLP
jgi:putative phosphoesterase